MKENLWKCTVTFAVGIKMIEISNASYVNKRKKLENHLWIDYSMFDTTTVCITLGKQFHFNFIRSEERLPYSTFQFSQFETIWLKVSAFQIRAKMREKALIFLTPIALPIRYVWNYILKTRPQFSVSISEKNKWKKIQSQTSIHYKKCNLETMHYGLNWCINETKKNNVKIL